MTRRPGRPTREEIAAAISKTVPDVAAPGLGVLFCGINPGLYTAAVGHHFARPGNRFWPALHASGFTPRLFAPSEQRELLQLGCGITNLVARATATADEVSRAELIAGARVLATKVRRLEPRFVAVVALQAYRVAFERPGAPTGRQPERLEGATLWLLPNPSGLNAHYSAADLARLFRDLREAVEAESTP